MQQIREAQLPIDLGSIQHQLGRLTEAVETFKEQSREQGARLDAVRLDVHAAKIAVRVLKWIVGGVGIIVGILLTAFLNHVFSGTAKYSFHSMNAPGSVTHLSALPPPAFNALRPRDVISFRRYAETRTCPRFGCAFMHGPSPFWASVRISV